MTETPREIAQASAKNYQELAQNAGPHSKLGKFYKSQEKQFTKTASKEGLTETYEQLLETIQSMVDYYLKLSASISSQLEQKNKQKQLDNARESIKDRYFTLLDQASTLLNDFQPDARAYVHETIYEPIEKLLSQKNNLDTLILAQAIAHVMFEKHIPRGEDLAWQASTGIIKYFMEYSLSLKDNPKAYHIPFIDMSFSQATLLLDGNTISRAGKNGEEKLFSNKMEDSLHIVNKVWKILERELNERENPDPRDKSLSYYADRVKNLNRRYR